MCLKRFFWVRRILTHTCRHQKRRLKKDHAKHVKRHLRSDVITLVHHKILILKKNSISKLMSIATSTDVYAVHFYWLFQIQNAIQNNLKIFFGQYAIVSQVFLSMTQASWATHLIHLIEVCHHNIRRKSAGMNHLRKILLSHTLI